MVYISGVFQSFYEQSLLSRSSSSRISWIGSTQAFLLIFGGIIVGPAYDRGHLRILIVTGSFLVVFGMAVTSIASEYWEIMLAQGVAVGMGGGCLFVPSVAVLPAYFVRRRALAMGLAAAGVSLGK
jgi:MFS family permease